MEPVRFGTLGAARITSQALLRPAARLEEAEVVAVAARDLARARRFAEKRRIPRVVSDYEALINDPDIDAVYNPLPNGLHGRWTIAALEAGKHVLCEKPFTANAAEAEEVAAVATESGKTCAEAFHYRYHPLWARALDLVAQGAVGRIEHVEATMCVPLFPPNDIRWSWPLAGGALMDIGCYAVNMVRSLAEEDTSVTSFTQGRAAQQPNQPRTVARSLREWLEFVPEKVMFATDAYPFSPELDWEESGWIAADTARRALAIALSGMMDDGEITYQRAVELARLVLRENARKLYGL